MTKSLYLVAPIDQAKCYNPCIIPLMEGSNRTKQYIWQLCEIAGNMIQKFDARIILLPSDEINRSYHQYVVADNTWP